MRKKIKGMDSSNQLTEPLSKGKDLWQRAMGGTIRSSFIFELSEAMRLDSWTYN